MGLTDVGRRLMLDKVIGAAGTVLDASNAYLGVGDSSTAFAGAQTDLQAASNKHREIVDSAPSRSTDTLTFVATLEAADANHAINEVAAFNASSAGTMFSRFVQALGTKASPAVWTITYTIAITGN